MKRNKNFTNNKSILYLVATPIGNMSEVSPRTIEILSNVAAIGCEDTRVTGKLLKQLNIENKLISCHEHNEEMASKQLMKHLENGNNIAYVSDAGYPGISDPGQRLVKNVLDSNYNVSVISGPNAMLNALVGSGLDTSHFYFHGFLPSKPSDRIKELNDIKNRKETIIFYESPHRISKTVIDLYKILGNRKDCIESELTKIHEEFIHGDLESFTQIDFETLIGEMVIVIEGKYENPLEISSEIIIKEAKILLDEGVSKKSTAKILSERLNISKNLAYELIIENFK